MQSLGKIREELKAIRYYYARKKVFDFGGKITGTHEQERMRWSGLQSGIMMQCVPHRRGCTIYMSGCM